MKYTEKKRIEKQGEQEIEVIDLCFNIHCECGVDGAKIEMTVPVSTDIKALAKDIDATYSHICDDCCCKGRHDPTHAHYGKLCRVNYHA